jgi:hypothetical protein
MIYPHVEYLGPAHPDRDNWERWTTQELNSPTTNGIRRGVDAAPQFRRVIPVTSQARARALP